jgi:lipopolysaccharide export system ATP-binding protein
MAKKKKAAVNPARAPSEQSPDEGGASPATSTAVSTEPPDGDGASPDEGDGGKIHASSGNDPQANAAAETAGASQDPELLLRVEGLTKTYGGRPVVHGVGFDVHRGRVIGLLGKNGAGKTTTFRMTVGMIAPDAGRIHFMGQDVTRYPMYKRARLGMGYLSQETSVFRGLTVEQNLNAILELTPLPSKDRVRRRDELVDEFGLGKLLHSKGAVLSGGEKRRLEIARALIMEPSLILLDEPFSGVDPIAVSEIQKIILKLTKRGIGILLTDHNVRETLNTTHRSFIILDGRIIAEGDRETIIGDPNARKHYLGEEFTM